jgi:hypothetical protein
MELYSPNLRNQNVKFPKTTFSRFFTWEKVDSVILSVNNRIRLFSGKKPEKSVFWKLHILVLRSIKAKMQITKKFAPFFRFFA